MLIGGITKLTLNDFPGKLACLIYAPGCNFTCPFCHNRDLVDVKKIKKLSLLEERDIFEFLKKRKEVLDGVVVTGGEPLLQSDLGEFLQKVKKLGFETMIETNGSKPKALESLIKKRLLDFIAMDYKTTFSNYTTVSIPEVDGRLVGRIKQSIQLIIKSGLPFEFRTTVVPTIHDKKVLLQMARELKKLTTHIKNTPGVKSAETPGVNGFWVLQSFQPKNCLDQKFNKIKPFDQDQMKGFLKVIQEVMPGAKLRN